MRQTAQEEESRSTRTEIHHTEMKEQPKPMTAMENEAQRQAEEFFNHATRIAQRHNVTKDKILFCTKHGPNPSHSTEDCQQLQSLNRRDQKYRPLQPRSEHYRVGNYKARDYRTEKNFRDLNRSQSRSRSRSRDRNFGNRYTDRHSRSSSRSPFRQAPERYQWNLSNILEEC